MAFAEVYMDESYDDRQTPPVLTIAGYLFRKQKAKEFSHAWRNYLRRKGLPYFHMRDCAHGSGTFKGRTDALEVETRLIELTKKYSAFGFALTVPGDDYERLLPHLEGMPQSPYAFALFAATMQVRKWIERESFQGKVAYYFESGYRHLPDADRFISWMFDSERVRQNSSYASHSFVLKDTPGLQPADLLAWQWRIEAQRKKEPNRKPVRKDLIALLREQDVTIVYDATTITHLSVAIAEAQRARHEIVRDVLAGVRELPDL